MANNKKRVTGNLTTTSTIPESTTGTGSDLTLTSGSDKFTLDVRIAEAEFKANAWIYDDSNVEVYRVKSIAPDGLSGVIWGTANDTVTLTDVEYISTPDSKIIKMYVEFVAAGTFDGDTIAAGNTINIDTIDEIAKWGSRYVEAAIVTGTDTNYILKKY